MDDDNGKPPSPDGTTRVTGRPITVGELRAELVGWPDQTPIAVLAQQSLDGSSWSNLDLRAAGHGPGADADDPVLASTFPLTAVYPAGGDPAEPCAWRHVARLQVPGRPATYSTAGDRPWRAAVHEVVERADLALSRGSVFAVRLDFRLPAPTRAGEAWDLDNLAKSTIDALDGVLGERSWIGPPQVAEDDHNDLWWADADRFLDHVQAWFDNSDAGWPDDRPDLELERYFRGSDDSRLYLYGNLDEYVNSFVRFRPAPNDVMRLTAGRLADERLFAVDPAGR